MQQITKWNGLWVLSGVVVLAVLSIFAPYKLPTLMMCLQKAALAIPVTYAAAWTLDKAFGAVDLTQFRDLALMYVGTCLLFGMTL